MFTVEGDNILYEIEETNNTKKIRIYVDRIGDKYPRSCKCFGTHIFEQTLNSDNEVIKEVIIPNPHYIDWKYPKMGQFYD